METRQYRKVLKSIFVSTVIIGMALTAGCSSKSSSPAYRISGTVSGAVSSSVSVALGGAITRTTTTDTGGNYSFSGLASGSYTVTPSFFGYTFSPITTAVTITDTNVTHIDFTSHKSGSPDLSFGSNGVVVTNTTAGGNNAWGNAIITDAQGRILVTGVAYDNSGNQNMAIWRFNADGTPDTSFGTNGAVFTNATANGNWATGNSITIDTQGRILVAGLAGDGFGNSNMAIWRYNADGTPDTSFGTNGAVFINTTAGDNWAYGHSLTIDPQGRILVTGYADDSSSNENMVIWRYNADGTPDTSFGTNGAVVTSTTAGGNEGDGRSIITDTQGRILVAGLANDGSGNDNMTIWRYNADSSPDTSFGTNGAVFTNTTTGGNSAYGQSITMDPQGRILVAGSASYNINYNDMVIWRYNADGTPDSDFGITGAAFTSTTAGGNSAGGNSIITDAQGRILVTGEADDSSGNPNMTIWRYNADGTPDTGFGTNGAVFTNTTAGGNNAWGYSIITDAQGRILVTGLAYDGSGNYNMVIWRYLP